jgi:anti-sigma B factor antagonist
MMTIKEKDLGEVVVLVFSEKIMGGPDASMLNDKLHELIEKGKTKIVADLANVDLINSSGLGILIQGLTTMRNSGGDLKLANVRDRIQNLLSITKLLTVFDAHETLEKAVASFNH